MNATDLLPALSPAEARHIDHICDRFEAAWRAGRRPHLEDYLDAVGEPERPALLRQLLLLDWDYRRRAGDDPRTDYLARFPDAAARIDDVGREMAEVGHSTRGGPDARHTPWIGDDTPVPADESAAGADAGAARYELLHEVGRGGIGVVFRGRDRHLGRELAVKVLREAYRDRPDARRRFLAEARVGSQLQHPGIVPVYELGRSGDGRPYLTMKLIEGHTLAELLRERADAGQDLPRWLSILEQVCQAMAYAHARGVVHRDLKPANVMVGEFGEVQVMDWGFAKHVDVADGQSSADRGASEPCNSDDGTQCGTMMGTPAYMPPEQAHGEAAGVDSRADVFALGAILCEVLTGQPPYVGGCADEVCHKAWAADLGDARARLDACGADATLRDLVTRCLAADRAARPPDAGGVARELTAYLASAQERLRQAQLDRAAAEARAAEAHAKAKAERRARRLTLTLAAAVLLLILGAAVAPTVAYLLLRVEQRQTESARSAAVEAREDEARRRQQTRRALDMLTGPVIDEWLGKQLGVTPEQQKFLEQALASYTEFAADTNTDEASRAGLAGAHYQVGKIQQILGRVAKAETAFDLSATMYQQLTTEFPDRREYRKQVLVVLSCRAGISYALGKPAESEAALRELIPLQRLFADGSDDPIDRTAVAWHLTDLSALALDRGRVGEAEELAQEAIRVFDAYARDSTHPHDLYGRARALNRLGLIRAFVNRFAEAAALHRQALQLQQPIAPSYRSQTAKYRELGQARSQLAHALRRMNELTEAAAEYREAIKISQQLATEFPGHPGPREDLGNDWTSLGNLLAQQNRFADAEVELRRSVDQFQQLVAERPEVPGYQFGLGRAYFSLGRSLYRQNQPKDAEAADCEASRRFGELAARDSTMPEYRHMYAGSLVNRAHWHRRRGEMADAHRLLSEAMPHHEAAVTALPQNRNYRLFLCMNRLGRAQVYADERNHDSVATEVEHLAGDVAASVEVNVQFPTELKNAAAFLARCVTLAEQDTRLSPARRAERTQEYAGRAITTLRMALKQGYKNTAELATDKAFAPIRSHPDFQKLLAELKPAPTRP